MGKMVRAAKVGRAVKVGREPVRQQVAAVCYRASAHGIEFLLVRTRGGRWIFPKGGVEPGLTQAQSAALEAFEEAGVHGRIEEMAFARYRVDKSADKKSGRDKRGGNGQGVVGRQSLVDQKAFREVARDDGRENKRSTETARAAAENGETVTAHLCEVSHLEAPQEAYRTPTWFSADKAKRRLMANRDDEFGAELANVVDRAVSRIRRLAASAGKEFQNDGLRRARFEAFDDARSQRANEVAARARPILIESRGSVISITGGKPMSRDDNPPRRRKIYVE
jgi:8-oxo-dGTP pyrophosphatase MutT (NUDIX family)